MCVSPPAIQKNTYVKTFDESILGVINYAKELPESYSLSSHDNLASLNMEESEVSAAVNYAKEFLGDSCLGDDVALPGSPRKLLRIFQGDSSCKIFTWGVRCVYVFVGVMCHKLCFFLCVYRCVYKRCQGVCV